MRLFLLAILLMVCSTQMIYSQEEDGVVSLALPIRNSLKFNRFIVNPTFSFVREQTKYISLTNKREWVQFEDAPLTYMASYSGRFSENSGLGIGLFQQNYGVLTTFGGIVNFAYNARLNTDSNLTFGLNVGAYKSGVNSGKVVTNFADPSLETIPSNFLLTINPGINYGTGFMDFGLSINNLALFNTSKLIENNPEQSVQAHIMYTGYTDGGGFFDESRFSGLIRSEFKKDKTVISGLAMLMVPKGIWAQVGYNNLYGASAGLGLNITEQIAIEYNFEKALGDLTDFGPSHEITLAYRFKNNENYDYSREDDVSALISGDRRKPVSKVSKVEAEANRKLAAETRAQAKLDAEAEAQAKLEEQAEAKLEAENKIKIEAEAKKEEALKAKTAAEAQSKVDAENKAKADEIAKTEADAAKIEAQAVAKEVEEAKAKIAAENKAKAEAKAKIDAEAAKVAAAAQAKIDAQAQAKLVAENKLKEDAKLKAEAARIAEMSRLKAEADAEAIRLAETTRVKEAADAKAKADAEATKLAEVARLQAETDAKAKAVAEATKLAEVARLKAETDAKVKADAEASRLAEVARLQAETDAKAKEDAEASRLEEASRLREEAIALAEAEKATLEAQARLKAEAEAKERIAADAKLVEEAKAKADAELKAKAASEAQVKLESEARLAVETQAKLDAETQAKADAKATEELIPNAADAISKSMNSIEKLTKDSETQQAELLTKYSEAIANKNKDLKDLKEENDLSDKGIFMEPKPFKSLTDENNALEAIKVDLNQVIETRNDKIKELEKLYEDRLKIYPLVNDEVNLYYQKAIKKLKAEQLNAMQSRTALTSNLDQIKEATEFERKRRIKRAAFDNEQDRYQQDRNALSILKQNTRLSTTPLKAEDFDFGEEQSSNIQILKNVKNVEDGYYLIVAVHNDIAKRDEFLTKAIASGRTNIDFFYDVNTSKYYIYYDKFDNVGEANDALKSKGNRPYNTKMSLVKIEN